MKDRHRESAGLVGMMLAGVVAFALTSSPLLHAARDAQAGGDVEAAARRFLAAFDALDMPRFLDAFSDDATIIHPPAGPPRTFPTRLQGKAEIARTFGVVFDEIRRASGRSAPPYQHLEPQDLLVQQYGDVAVLTFHLGTDARRGRRTIVFRQIASAWKIVHLHASVFETAAR